MSKLTRKGSGLAFSVVFGCFVALFTGLYQAESLARQYDESDKSKGSVSHKSVGNTEANSDVVETILRKLRTAKPDLIFKDAKPSVIEGLYDVEFNGGGKIYSSASGDYFITGEVYKVNNNGLVNLSEVEKNGDRAAGMAELKESEMIVFSPAKETKASVYVFTDVDCGYCRLLHKEVPQLNAMGIEVRYLAFPRAGLKSESYNKISSAWCSDDKLNAMNLLKSGQSIPTNVCADNPVASQYYLGQQLGVSGTPAIVLESGELIPGYVKAPELARRLNL